MIGTAKGSSVQRGACVTALFYCLLTVSCVGKCGVNQEWSVCGWIVECNLHSLSIHTYWEVRLTSSWSLFIFLVHGNTWLFQIFFLGCVTVKSEGANLGFVILLIKVIHLLVFRCLLLRKRWLPTQCTSLPRRTPNMPTPVSVVHVWRTPRVPPAQSGSAWWLEEDRSVTCFNIFLYFHHFNVKWRFHFFRKDDIYFTTNISITNNVPKHKKWQK